MSETIPQTKARGRRVPEKALCQNQVFDAHLSFGLLGLVQVGSSSIFPSPQSSKARDSFQAHEQAGLSCFCAFAYVTSPT
jgi:hypothetical protein